jgi:alkane 1-monooxygenase
MTALAASTRRSGTWMVVAGSYLGYLLFVLFATALSLRGLAFGLPTLFVIGLVPAFDLLCGENRKQFSSTDFSKPQRGLLRAAPIGFIAGNAVVIWTAIAIFGQLTKLEQCLAVLSVGMISSVGIAAAHELIHKRGALQKYPGRLGLLNVCYLHFEINHIESHHVWMATDRDESTARLGESVYQFVARTVPGCWRLSWHLELRRMRHRKRHSLSPSNRMLQYVAAELAYVALLFYLWGMPALILFLCQAMVAVFMLEAVAYIEHYGLHRARLSNGRYGPMTAEHSWDSYRRFSNYMEFHLQRHADHHASPVRAHENLRTSGGALQLPAGYSVMISLAMIPPLWKAVMHQRLASAGRVATGSIAARSDGEAGRRS